MMKSSTLCLITNSNIFIMKKLLFSSLLLLSSLASQAQNEYTIEGDVKGVKDGTLVSLFLTDGRVGSVVASDTIRNGTFFFKRNAGESGMDQLSLMCNREADFPPMSLKIYATPNAKIKVTGTNTLIYTWKVDSPVKVTAVFLVDKGTSSNPSNKITTFSPKS